MSGIGQGFGGMGWGKRFKLRFRGVSRMEFPLFLGLCYRGWWLKKTCRNAGLTVV